MHSFLMLAATATVPHTLQWSPKVGLIMLLCNVLAIAIGKRVIQRQNDGPEFPGLGMSVGSVLGTTSFGHILGTGAILGLAYLGAI